MSKSTDRLKLAAVLTVLIPVTVLGAAVAGAASAPAPLPAPAAIQIVEPPDLSTEPVPNAPAAVKRYTGNGVVVGIRESRLAVRVKGREQPLFVAVRPMTSVRLNGRPAVVEDYRIGDRVVFVGRPGPLGNVVVARGINVVRPPAPGA